MLQIVTLRGDYQYQIAHLYIINFTKGATWFINIVVLNILWQKSRQQNNWLMSLKHILFINESCKFWSLYR